ncbi:MAG: ABC transporter permease subunit [Planctomycetaceae bacterium]|nr:ABC transporter permease subunit [Planctomycetaceae bacterium]
MWQTIYALIAKDLLIFRRDRTALALTFLLPIALGSVFGTAMSGVMGGASDSTPVRVGLAVEDRDQTGASRALVDALSAANGLDVDVVDDAERRVESGKRACAILIPKGYEATVAAGRTPELVLLRDPSQAISQQVVLFQLAPVLLQQRIATEGPGLFDSALEALDFPALGRPGASAVLRTSFDDIQTLLLESSAATAGDATPAGTAFDPLAELPGLLGLDVRDAAGNRDDGPPRSAGAAHAFSAMAVMMLLFTVVGAGGTLLQERNEGTLTRLQLTPAAGNAVLLGKLGSVGLIAFLQLVVLFAFAGLVYGVPVLADPLPLVLVSCSWVLLAVGIGLFLAVVCRSQKQLEGLSTLIILVMSALGGAWFPREITPEWFRAVGSFLPVAWAMDAFHGIFWYGKGLLPTETREGIGREVLQMVGLAAVLLVLSVRLFAQRYGSRAR